VVTVTHEIDRLPPLHSGVAAVVLISLLTLLTGLYTGFAAPFGVASMLAATVSMLRGWRRAATWSGSLLFLGAVAAGTQNAPTFVVLLAVSGAVVAWDLLDNAVSLGEQLGREASTGRAELVHVGGSAVVGLAVSLGAYGLYTVVGGGKPLSALVLFLLAAVALTSVLRN